MRHCRQCRADAVGMLGEDRSQEFTREKLDALTVNYDPSAREDYRSYVEQERADQRAAQQQQNQHQVLSSLCALVAVATKGGGRINQHFGHANEFQIFEVSNAGVRFVGHRKIDHYCKGGYEEEEAMIGDDVVAVCKAAAQKFGKPVVPVNAPGFVGSKNLGNKLGGEALLDYVIGTREPDTSTPYDINLIGEYNVVGELWQVKPLFDELGIRILATISGDGRYHDIACAHRARAAIMNLGSCSACQLGDGFFQ